LFATNFSRFGHSASTGQETFYPVNKLVKVAFFEIEIQQTAFVPFYGLSLT
jgi:hypothetical protein